MSESTLSRNKAKKRSIYEEIFRTHTEDLTASVVNPESDREYYIESLRIERLLRQIPSQKQKHRMYKKGISQPCRVNNASKLDNTTL